MWGPNPLHLEEKPLALRYLRAVGFCARDGVYIEIVSQPLLPAGMWAFCHSPERVGGAQFLGFFPEEIVRI